MSEQTALAMEHPGASYLDVTMASSNLTALKMRHNLLVNAMRDVLTDGVDYGKIPGTGDKPTLLKAGAENLSFLFGLRPTFELIDRIEDWDRGLFYYRYRCTLHDGAARVVANSEGSCNTRETKYRYRNEDRKCPKCGKTTIIKGKVEYGGGWLCYAKKGGCGAKFSDGDPAIESQVIGKVENSEPYELVNTVQKMAQKRALVAAVLVGTGASQFFTQDVEDMVIITVDVEPKPVEAVVVKREADTAPEKPKAVQPQPEVDAVSNGCHWIERPDVRKRFWAWAKGLGLSEDDAHTALGVLHVSEYPGTMNEARSIIEAYATRNTAPEAPDLWDAEASGSFEEGVA